jgi:hypothetical protein
MRKLVFNLLLTTMMGALFMACEGPEGAVGPAGPAGAQGPKGDKGDKGDPGDSSEDTIPVVFTFGAIEGVADGGTILELPGVTESDADGFVALVYIKSLGAWWPLPGMVNFGDGKSSTYTVVHGVVEDTFYLELVLTGYSENIETIPARNFEDVKVVIIPAVLMNNAKVDLSNYEEVIATFNPTERSITK